jgi:predicted dehydrogenase
MNRMNKRSPVKCAITGCGGITPTIIKGFRGFEELELVAVQDIDVSVAELVAREFDVPDHYTDFSEMIDQDFEMLVINTPNDLHMPMAIQALDSGKHCLVQKPIARNTKEAKAMIEASKRNNRLLGVVMLERADPVNRQIRSMVQEGCFGKVTVFRAALAHVDHLKKPPAPGSWRRSQERIGGGSFIQLAIHHIDLAQFIIGQEISEVAAMSSSVIAPELFPVDETTAASVRFSDGALGQFVSSFTTIMDSIEIYGTRGMISRDHDSIKWRTSKPFQGDVWDSEGKNDIQEIMISSLSERISQLYPAHEPHRQFALAIRGAGEVETSGAEGIQALKIVEAVMKSSESGRMISIR